MKKPQTKKAIQLCEAYLSKQEGLLQMLRFLCVISCLAFATKSAMASDCQRIHNFNEALECAKVNHPDILKSKLGKSKAQGLLEQAKKIPNLELSGKSMRNTQNSDQNSGELGVVYTFELGGKRQARVDRAQSEDSRAQLEFLSAEQEALLQTAEKIYELTFLRDEESLIESGINTFEKILKSYRGRLKLSPEQEISSQVFSLALEDYKIRKSHIAVDKVSLVKSLEIITGGKVELSDSFFPPEQKAWPDKTQSAPSNQVKVRLLEASLASAQSEVKLAESEAWPDIKLGPNYEWSNQGDATEKSLGVVFSFPLPLWNRNQGGISASMAEAEIAKGELNFAKMESESQKEILLLQYQEGVKTLKNSLSRDVISKRERELKNQFLRGLVPSSLIIEAHRQLLEFTKSRNELELKTLSALWGLDFLEGKGIGALP